MVVGNNEQIHPLVYFWIAFYKDGTCLPQFDLETGKMNPFKSIDQSKLEKFGIYPFNAPFSIKVNLAEKSNITREEEGLPFFIMHIQPTQRLIYVRRNRIHIFTYQHCDKCGYEWQWIPDCEDGSKTEVGLLAHTNHITQNWNGKEYNLGQCPKCNSFNAVICTECKDAIVNELAVPNQIAHAFRCSKCNKEYPRYIRLFEGNNRDMVYLLGHQTTTEDSKKNVKQIMFIDEDGTFELNEDFNYK